MDIQLLPKEELTSYDGLPTPRQTAAATPLCRNLQFEDSKVVSPLRPRNLSNSPRCIENANFQLWLLQFDEELGVSN
jgi:hypothetical protein